MKKIYILLLSFLTLCSCEEQKITGALFSKSFLQGFIDIKEIASGNISNNDELYFMFQGDNIARGHWRTPTYHLQAQWQEYQPLAYTRLYPIHPAGVHISIGRFVKRSKKD